eukprot:PhM_4_TR13012/c0_g1_i1/m.13806
MHPRTDQFFSPLPLDASTPRTRARFEASNSPSRTLTPRSLFRDDKEQIRRLEAHVQSLEYDLDSKRRLVSRLESDAIRHSRAAGDAKADEDAQRFAAVALYRKDLESEREKVRRLEAQLSVENERRQTLQARADKHEREVRRLSALESRSKETERAFADKSTDYNDLVRRSQQLEKQLVEQRSSTSSRVLEGKVSGLQKLVESRTQDAELEREKTAFLDKKVEDLKEAMAQMQRKLDAAEATTGSYESRLTESKKEIERWEKKCASLELEVEGHVAKCGALQREAARHEANRDTKEHELSELLRAKARATSELESDHLELVNKHEQLEKEYKKLTGAFSAQSAETASLRTEVEIQKEVVSEFEASLSREKHLRLEAESEVKRCKNFAKAQRDEFDAVSVRNASLEQKNHELQQELQRHVGLEEQLATLQKSFERQELDLVVQTRRHDETVVKLEATNEKLEGHAKLQKAHADLQSKFEQSTEASAALSREGEAMAMRLEELRREVERELRRAERAESILADETKERHELEQRVIELQGEVAKSRTTVSKVGELETLLAETREQLDGARTEVADRSIRVAELEAANERLRAFEEMCDELEAEVATLRGQLVKADETELDLKREAAAVASELDAAKRDLAENREHVVDLEDAVSVLRTQVAEKESQAQRVADLESEVQATREEATRFHSEAEGLRQKAKNTEDALAQERERSHRLEAQLAAEIEVVEAQQIDVGRNAVQLEDLTREIAKLKTETDHCEQMRTLAQDQLERVRAELTEAHDALDASTKREAEAARVLSAQLARLRNAEASVETLTLELQESVRKCCQLEESLAAAAAKDTQITTMEGRMGALEATCRAKDTEIEAKNTQLYELRQHVRELTVRSDATEKLEVRLRELRTQNASQSATIETLELAAVDAKKRNINLEKTLQQEREHSNDLEATCGERQQQVDALHLKISALERALVELNAMRGRAEAAEATAEARACEAEEALREVVVVRNRSAELERELAVAQRQDDIVFGLEQQVALKTQCVEQLEAEATKRSSFIDRLQADLTAATEKSTALQHSLDMESERTAQLEHKHHVELERAHDELEKAKQEVRSSALEVSKLRVLLDEARAGLEAEATMAQRHQQQLEHARRENQSAKSMLMEAEKSMGVLEVEAGTVRRQLETSKMSVTQLTEALFAERERAARLERELDEAFEAQGHGEMRCATEVSSRDAEISRLQRDIDDLRQALDDRTQRLQERGIEYTEELARSRTVEGSLRVAEEKIALLEEQLDHSTHQSDILRSTVSQLTDRTQQLDAALHEKHRELSQAAHNMAGVQKRLQAQEKKCDETAASLSRVTAELTEARTMNVGSQRTHETELRDLRVQYRSLVGERDALREQQQRLQRDIAALNASQADKFAQYERTVAMLSQKSHGADELIARVKDSAQHVEQLREENQRLRGQLTRK